ncbi:MAG: ABC-2 type transport system ATP-binding protein [Halioglobus sp.]|jgi:ABC-2 type transport system ATP-binding protein
MIQVRHLTRRYGKHNAVSNVSFDIKPNEVVGLLGHNGAGKTTIMKMLSGYLEPTAGSIHIAGLNMATRARQIQQQLGYLPENLPIYPEMLLADYLEYAATLKRIPPKERMMAVRDVVLAADLEDRILDPIDTLSRGMRQRLGVAQALLGKPRLIIFDEPTNGLDPEQTDHMRRLIKQLARRATIILSTHIMQEVEAVCDRVLILSRGGLVLDETLQDLCCTSALRLRVCDGNPSLASYLGRLPQITKVVSEANSEANQLSFTLNLHENSDPNTAANNITQCVVKAGARLYELKPLERDLESVFRQASAEEGLAHAR